MEVGKLTVQHRDKTGKGISRSTRRSGDVPGVCYGVGMDAPIAISVSPKALKACLDPTKRRNTVIDVTIEKGGAASTTLQAMVWDYQVHPIKQVITHVDLKSIDPNKKVDAEVPVRTSGEYKGAIDGGLLSWARHQVTISAKPADIPSELVLDISDLGLGDTLHISDLSLPEGVEFSDSLKLTVITCIAPKGLKSDGDVGEESAEGEGEDGGSEKAAEEEK